MGTAPEGMGRFKMNPVEVVIFAAVALIFVNSIYNLFYDPSGFQATALAPTAAGPVDEGRAPASTSSATLNARVDCAPRIDGDAQNLGQASKIRILGELCGWTPGLSEPKGREQLKPLVRVTQDPGGAEATPFTETSEKRFSTDYINLRPGTNKIRIEFNYKGANPPSVELVINKK